MEFFASNPAIWPLQRETPTKASSYLFQRHTNYNHLSNGTDKKDGSKRERYQYSECKAENSKHFLHVDSSRPKITHICSL